MVGWGLIRTRSAEADRCGEGYDFQQLALSKLHILKLRRIGPWVTVKMGKNQAYKAMQRAKMASAGGPEDIDDGMMDGSFHSPEWHAARLASLQTSHTVTWDEFNKRQKEAEKRRSELDAAEARRMKEYRAQLDAERASKLARGRNHAERKLSSDKGRKDKDKNGRSSKKIKHSGKRHRDRSVSDPDMDSASSSDDERHASRKERSKFKKLRKERKRKSRSEQSRSFSGDAGSESKEHGPIRLSSFFDGGKD